MNRYLLILIFLILLLLLTVYGCVYAGPMRTDTNKTLYGPGPPKGITYYNTSDDGSIQTYFHEGGVTNCVVTSSTVTCY